MESALLRLRKHQDSMSITERAVSDYVLNHQEEAVELSIHQLAKRAFASPSTVIRMCQRMGFAGYKEFRKAVTCELAVSRMGQERREITRADSLDDIVEKVTYQNIMSLEDAIKLVDTQVLRSCVNLLNKARTVLLFGLGASQYTIRNLTLKLLRLNKPCVTNEDWPTQLFHARNATKEDLAIVVLSYSWETSGVVQCMNALRENQTPIVAITSRESSPVTELADYHLYTADDDSAIQAGNMSAQVSQMNIIDILSTAYANSQWEHSTAQPPEMRALDMA